MDLKRPFHRRLVALVRLAKILLRSLDRSRRIQNRLISGFLGFTRLVEFGWSHHPSPLVSSSSIATSTIALIVVALIVQTARIEGFKFWPFSVAGYKAELKAANDKLADLAKPINQQREETDRNMVETRTIIKEVEVPARRVETAPLPGQCKTPSEVLQADL